MGRRFKLNQGAVRALTAAGSAWGSWRLHRRCGRRSSGLSSVYSRRWTSQSRTCRPGESCQWWERYALSRCSSDPPWNIQTQESLLGILILNLMQTEFIGSLDSEQKGAWFSTMLSVCAMTEGWMESRWQEEKNTFLRVTCLIHLTPLCLHLYSV